MDIAPTIADVVGIDIPWAVDGVSLLEDGATEGRPHRFRPVWLDEVTAGADGLAELESVTFDDRVACNAVLPRISPGSCAAAAPRRSPLIGAEVADLTVDDTDPPTDDRLRGQDRTVSPDAPVPAFVLAGFDDVPSWFRRRRRRRDRRAHGAGRRSPRADPSFWGLLPEEALGAGQHRVELPRSPGSTTHPCCGR
ncbi:MAG: hypothetical protein R2690_09405 [Acidimicrobiales bacterium]